jgi:ATP sulfurylase
VPSVTLSPRALCDLECLATGVFSPLDRFMSREDHARVVEEMRLTDGRLFPRPITLPVSEAALPPRGDRLALRDSQNHIVAVLTVAGVHAGDRSVEARMVAGTEDPRHPLVAEMAGWGAVCVTGPLEVLALPRHHDFPELRLAPEATRQALARLATHVDVATHEVTRLFHPRRDRWEEHFAFERPWVAGRTGIGRTTVWLLQMNAAERVDLRSVLSELGELD